MALYFVKVSPKRWGIGSTVIDALKYADILPPRSMWTECADAIELAIERAEHPKEALKQAAREHKKISESDVSVIEFELYALRGDGWTLESISSKGRPRFKNYKFDNIEPNPVVYNFVMKTITGQIKHRPAASHFNMDRVL